MLTGRKLKLDVIKENSASVTIEFISRLALENGIKRTLVSGVRESERKKPLRKPKV